MKTFSRATVVLLLVLSLASILFSFVLILPETKGGLDNACYFHEAPSCQRSSKSSPVALFEN